MESEKRYTHPLNVPLIFIVTFWVGVGAGGGRIS